MARNQLRFEGLDQLLAELRALPADLTAEARHEVIGAANGAAASVKAAYPVDEGRLRDGVQVLQDAPGPFGEGAVVKNTAPHAYLFEHGTQARRNARGQNRGAMPPGRVFIPRIMRARQLMYERLKAIVARKGLSVSGDA
jgi:hypothetical protein